MERIVYVWILLIVSGTLFGQAPVISSVERPVSFPLSKVTINGSGFNADPNQLKVWFGPVQGQILNSTQNLIEVRVPPGAHADNITVLNLATKLSGKSSIKYYSFFSGTAFDPASVGTSLKFNDSKQLLDLCTCDFNRDGKADIAATKFDATSASIKVLINQSTLGNIQFNEPGAGISLSAPTNDIACGDLNGDGWPDLVATKGGGSGIDRNSIYIIPNSAGSVTSSIAINLPAGTVTTEKIVIRDLNFDGLPELIVSNSKTNEIYIFRNTSTGSISYDSNPIKVVLTGVDSSNGLEVQDLNRDNRPEIIIAAKKGVTADIQILPNTSTQDNLSFGSPVSFGISSVIQDIITGDFNRDGLLDIATSSAFGVDKVNVLLNSSLAGVINFGTPTSFTAKGAWGLDIGDVDGDGWLDLMVGNINETNFHIINNTSTIGAFSMSPKTVSVEYKTRNTTINDFDGDGKPDFAFTSQSDPTFNIEILRNENCHIPIILSETPRKICSSQVFEVFAVPSPGTTYTWTLDGNVLKTGPDPFVSVGMAGTLVVTAVSEGGSCSEQSSPVIWEDGTGTIPGDPVISNNGPVCQGDILQLTAPLVLGAEYIWTGPNNFTSNLQSPQIIDARPENAGEYLLAIKLGDCQSSEISTVAEVYTFPTLFIDSSTGDGFCEGTGSLLSVPNVSGLSYEWFLSGSPTVLSTSSTLNISVGGDYYVEVTNISLGCVTTLETLSIESTPAPTATITPSKTTACAGEELTFSVNANGDPNQTLAFSWDFGDGSISTDQNPAHIFATANTYQVDLTVSYVGLAACEVVESVNITVTDAVVPGITADLNPICPGEQTNLSVIGTYNSIDWSTSETGASITVDSPGLYSIVTMDANGCQGNANITVDSKIVPSVTVFDLATNEKDTAINQGESIQLIAFGADSYEWKPTESLDDASLSNPTAMPLSSTSYTVTGYSVDNCTDSATVNVRIIKGQINVEADNSFSPNGDSQFDTWFVSGIENYTECTMLVFDRRGRIVFTTVGYNNDWGGTYNGSALPAGTYFWTIKCPDPELIPKKGSILLVK